MTHDDDGRVAELLSRLGDGDTKELFRRLLEAGMQELIDAELTAAIGAAPHERIETRWNQRNQSRSRLLSTPAGADCGTRRLPSSIPAQIRDSPAHGPGRRPCGCWCRSCSAGRV